MTDNKQLSSNIAPINIMALLIEHVRLQHDQCILNLQILDIVEEDVIVQQIIHIKKYFHSKKIQCIKQAMQNINYFKDQLDNNAVFMDQSFNNEGIDDNR